MFGSPLLDVVIGLTYIFLIYSLMATSVKEAIATSFGLRSGMLKQGIAVGMLSNTSNDIRWKSILLGILNFLKEIIYRIGFWPAKKEWKKNLGDKFFDHPLIRNYGSSRIYPTPSYIPKDNFSTVLIDILKGEFRDKLEFIALYYCKIDKPTCKDMDTVADQVNKLNALSDILKIKEVLEFYARKYQEETPARTLTGSIPSYITPGTTKLFIIDLDTLKILQVHLRESFFNMDDFRKGLEDWFEYSMNRVSGWYKRQAQFILFGLGLMTAVLFNVDVLQTAKILSRDKDARDQMVQLAGKSLDNFKNDPRVQQAVDKKQQGDLDKLFKEYQDRAGAANAILSKDAITPTSILTGGWKDFGLSVDSARVSQEYAKELSKIETDLHNKTPAMTADTLHRKALEQLYDDKYIRLKGAYVWSQLWLGNKFLSLLILAFGISLGAPFWFDLLSKLMQIRGAGKKEDGGDTPGKTGTGRPVSTPAPITINTAKSGEEAVG
ncbi:MAG TPA: hypothetical protein VF974_07735 [Patescibacteria group bacterium]